MALKGIQNVSAGDFGLFGSLFLFLLIDHLILVGLQVEYIVHDLSPDSVTLPIGPVPVGVTFHHLSQHPHHSPSLCLYHHELVVGFMGDVQQSLQDAWG